MTRNKITSRIIRERKTNFRALNRPPVVRREHQCEDSKHVFCVFNISPGIKVI